MALCALPRIVPQHAGRLAPGLHRLHGRVCHDREHQSKGFQYASEVLHHCQAARAGCAFSVMQAVASCRLNHAECEMMVVFFEPH